MNASLAASRVPGTLTSRTTVIEEFPRAGEARRYRYLQGTFERSSAFIPALRSSSGSCCHLALHSGREVSHLHARVILFFLTFQSHPPPTFFSFPFSPPTLLCAASASLSQLSITIVPTAKSRTESVNYARCATSTHFTYK